MAFLLLAGSTAGCDDAPEAGAQPAAPDVRFVDVTAAAGLGAFRHETGASGNKWHPETIGSGGAFLDYDGDGRLDVALVGGGSWSPEDAPPAVRLYRGRSDGTFEDVTGSAGLERIQRYAFGLVPADYDNDGDPDLFVTTLGRDLLLRNDVREGGGFVDVAERAGVAGPAHWTAPAVFFDADRNGHLDLYVGGYMDWSPETDLACFTRNGTTKLLCSPESYPGLPGHFYHNQGDGTFADRTDAAGFGGAPGKALGAIELDYNRDGRPDLFVANDLERNLLYRNDGVEGGVPRFSEVGLLEGVAFDENGQARAGMGVDAGVVDTTGRPTVFIGNFSGEMIGVFRAGRDGPFSDRATRSGVGYPSMRTLAFGLLLLDVESDGDLDLFVANGHVEEDVAMDQPSQRYRQPPQLFLNRGDGRFEEWTAPANSPLAEPLVGRGAAHGDFDGDGDLDLLLTEGGGPAHLWRNDTPRMGHWLRVRLAGTASPRDGVGSRIVAHADGRAVERQVRAGGSYLSGSALAPTFGLGDAAVVDSLVVFWTAGGRQAFYDVTADQALFIEEGTPTLHAPDPLARSHAVPAQAL